MFPGNGNVHEAVTDFDGPGLLKFKRSYNSRNGWVHNFLTRLIIKGNTIEALRSDGSYFLFTGSAQSGWHADPDVNYQLISLPAGDPTGAAYKLVTNHDAVERYDASGLPISVTARGGASVHMSYQNGLLSQVTDDFNRSLTFSYDGHDRLASMTTPAGEQYTYKYDSPGRLTKVGYPDGTSIKYVYEDDTYPFLLTGIIDQDSNRIATWTYDRFGRAVSVSGANGVNAYQFTYQPDDRYVKVTDPLGTVRTLTYQNSQGQLIMTSSDDPCANFGRDVASKTVGYNAQVTRITDYKGNQTLLGYNSRNLVTNITRAWNTGSQMVTQLQYSPSFRLPTLIQEPGKTDQRSYDATGNLIQQTLTDTTTGNTRTRSATYDSYGRLLTRTDADGNVTRYAYDGKGNLASITDALGHTTSFTHDADGRLLTKTDPNGLETKYTYDAVGRMVSRTVGTERTAYTYDPAGNLILVTLPSGYTLKLTYDAAHRLVGVKDSLGDRLVYTLNTMGNRVDEKLYDPDGTQVYSHSRIYDALDRLEKDIAAGGQTTTYGYDANSNLSSVQDPLGHITQTHYDPLNRRVQTIDALSGVTNYSYDPNGYLSQVVTPNGATTNYSHDGFGQILQESSPDRGVTTYTYDPVGNLVNKTDARGVIAAYAYDPLNRLTGIQYSAAAGSSFTGNPASDDITLTYDHGDGCTNGVGKLCAAKDASGTSLYRYDPYGNTLTQVHRDADTKDQLTTRYRYDALNKVVAITYPDGRKATFKRDGIGRLLALSARINGHRQMIIADRQFRADDQIVNQSFGNGLVDQRVYTARGLLSNWDLTGRKAHDRDYSYDDNGNQLGWNSNSTSAAYQYDALDRLIDEQQGRYHNAYSYDANGNRLSQLLPDGGTKAYSYAPQSNRMTQNGGTAVRLDAAGNTLDDGKYQYRYNAAGRLAEVQQGGQAIASYRYDYQGLRRQKITAEGTTDFTYDTSGHLISQQTKGGQDNGQRDYLWTDTAPIARIDSPIGQAKVHKDWLPQALMGFLHHHEGKEHDRAARLYYFHTDAMGTPRLATDAKQQVVWRWNEDAFGAKVSTDQEGHGDRNE